MNATEDELTGPMPNPPGLLKAMQELIQDGENDVARLPEHFFVSHLLPVLTSKEEEVDVTIWLDIAGSGFRPIDVFDSISGETLFRVPALYRRPPTTVHKSFEGSMSSLLHTAAEKHKQHPAIGQTYLKNTLKQRQIHEEVDLEQVRQWNVILKRYGHEPIVSLDDSSPTTAQESAEPPKEIKIGNDQVDF